MGGKPEGDAKGWLSFFPVLPWNIGNQGPETTIVIR